MFCFNVQLEVQNLNHCCELSHYSINDLNIINHQINFIKSQVFETGFLDNHRAVCYFFGKKLFHAKT